MKNDDAEIILRICAIATGLGRKNIDIESYVTVPTM